jgi:hypothetical protein
MTFFKGTIRLATENIRTNTSPTITHPKISVSPTVTPSSNSRSSAGGFAYGTPQNTDSKGDAGNPGTDRVIFDICFQFAAVMTHKLLDESQLRSCYEVDATGRPINSREFQEVI